MGYMLLVNAAGQLRGGRLYVRPGNGPRDCTPRLAWMYFSGTGRQLVYSRHGPLRNGFCLQHFVVVKTHQGVGGC